MNIEIADRLVQLRKESNLSQEDLAAKLGVSRQAVSKWERCESSPDTDNLIALARLYGVSLDALLLAGGGEAVQAQAESRYDSASYRDGPSMYEEQMAWETEEKKRRRSMLLKFPYPILVVMAFLFIGFFFGWWHPGWMIFLTIPLYYWYAATQA